MTKRPFQPGDTCKVVADVGVNNSDDSSVPSVELRGARVKVAGANSTYEHADTGETMVGVTHENGALSAIPARALRHEGRGGVVAGFTRAFAEGWDRIFGSRG